MTTTNEITVMQSLGDGIESMRPSDRGKAARLVRDTVAGMMEANLDPDAIERVLAYGVMRGEQAERKAAEAKAARTAAGTPEPADDDEQPPVVPPVPEA